MAGYPHWPLRQGIRTKLLAASGLTALVGQRVHDDVPQEDDRDYPFVVVDKFTSSEEGDKTNNVTVIEAFIYAWSEYNGYMEVEQVLSEVYDALHNSAPTVSGYDVLVSQFSGGDEGRDDDGTGRWGVARFRFMLDPQ